MGETDYLKKNFGLNGLKKYQPSRAEVSPAEAGLKWADLSRYPY